MVAYKLLMCPTSNHHQNFQSFDVCKTSLEYSINKAHMVKVFKMIFNTMIACYLYLILQIKYVNSFCVGPICIH